MTITGMTLLCLAATGLICLTVRGHLLRKATEQAELVGLLERQRNEWQNFWLQERQDRLLIEQKCKELEETIAALTSKIERSKSIAPVTKSASAECIV